MSLANFMPFVVVCFQVPVKRQVDQENQRQLQALAGESVVFEAEEYCKHPNFAGQLEKHCTAPKTLVLKINAQVCSCFVFLTFAECPSYLSGINAAFYMQVILLRNVDMAAELVNGSRGVVIGFHYADDDEVKPVVRFLNGATRTLSAEGKQAIIYSNRSVTAYLILFACIFLSLYRC